MTPAHLIEHARQSGVVLALNDDRLTWSASQQPPPDLLALLRDNKPAVIEHLRQQQRAWLERVAALLNTTADDLLARGLIDANDMAEQHRTDPRHAAKLIASCPNWHAMVRVRGQFCAQYARACARGCVPGCVPDQSRPFRAREGVSETGSEATDGHAGGEILHILHRPLKGECEQGPVRETNPISRSPEWIAARDALHRHSVSSCPGCHPPTGRYCPTGRALLAQYLEQQP
jgi:hypothetical protein